MVAGPAGLSGHVLLCSVCGCEGLVTLPLEMETKIELLLLTL